MTWRASHADPLSFTKNVGQVKRYPHEPNWREVSDNREARGGEQVARNVRHAKPMGARNSNISGTIRATKL